MYISLTCIKLDIGVLNKNPEELGYVTAGNSISIVKIESLLVCRKLYLFGVAAHVFFSTLKF